MTAWILHWKIARVHNNSNMKTWKRTNDSFKLSSNFSNKSLMQSLGEKGNFKLLKFFDQKRTLSTPQCGVWGKRITFDLEAAVMKADTNCEQFVSIFFDLGKTQDLTRRHGISMDLNEVILEGRLFKLIQNFLIPRSFKFKVNEILSDTNNQTEAYLREA